VCSVFSVKLFPPFKKHQPSESGSVSGSQSGIDIGLLTSDDDSDCDPIPIPTVAFPAALSGSNVKATGFAVDTYSPFYKAELSIP